MRSLPFVEEILADLRRFKECVEDNQDVDLDRDRFDLLTQLGLLERVQRSPAQWMMTQAGEDAIALPAAGEPVAMQARMPGCRWENYHKDDLDDLVAAGMEVRWLYTAPPAAAHGDEAERIGKLLELADRHAERRLADARSDETAAAELESSEENEAVNWYAACISAADTARASAAIIKSLTDEIRSRAAMRAQGDES